MSPAEIREAARAARQVIETRVDRLYVDADLADALCLAAAHVLESDSPAIAAALLREAGRVSEPYRLLALEFEREGEP